MPKCNSTNSVRVAISRSHVSVKTKEVIDNYVKQNTSVVTISAGSALKFGLVANGEADIYPRCSPTMEWDTAAGQIIVDEVGKKVMVLDSDQILQYNKCELINPGFIVA